MVLCQLEIGDARTLCSRKVARVGRQSVGHTCDNNYGGFRPVSRRVNGTLELCEQCRSLELLRNSFSLNSDSE